MSFAAWVSGGRRPFPAGRLAGTRKAALLLGGTVLASLLSWGQAHARGPARVAVVIGNGAYENPRLPDLPNAVRDAAALAEALRRLGFAVIEASDATGARIERLVGEALEQKPAEAILVFYAGHAVAVGGETFLLPADSPAPTSLDRLTAGAPSLSRIVNRLADGKRATLILLDACRSAFGAPDPGTPPRAGDNVLLGFSAQPGSAAADGAGRNSPFARALLRFLETPGVPVSVLMAQVRAETVRLTFGRQVPWSRSTLRGNFVFKARAAAAPPGG